MWYVISDAGDGFVALDFNVTPLGAEDTQRAWGPLFNFQVTFDNPGRWQLGFQQENVVSRTYYQNRDQTPDFFWGDISNDHPGIANSIVAVP